MNFRRADFSQAERRDGKGAYWRKNPCKAGYFFKGRFVKGGERVERTEDTGSSRELQIGNVPEKN